MGFRDQSLNFVVHSVQQSVILTTGLHGATVTEIANKLTVHKVCQTCMQLLVYAHE